MKPLVIALVSLPLLAACATTSSGLSNVLGGLGAPVQPEVKTLPAAVAAVMPPGTNPNIVMQDGNGCYIYAIEKSEPQTGFLIRDSKGQPICAGSTVTQVAVTQVTAEL